MHESDARSVSTVPKGEQVKMTSFRPPDGRFRAGCGYKLIHFFILDAFKKINIPTQTITTAIN